MEDNGPGHSASFQDTLFYPMVSGREGGTGLGLSIARNLIDQHSGKIEFTSWPGIPSSRFTCLSGNKGDVYATRDSLGSSSMTIVPSAGCWTCARWSRLQTCYNIREQAPSEVLEALASNTQDVLLSRYPYAGNGWAGAAQADKQRHPYASGHHVMTAHSNIWTLRSALINEGAFDYSAQTALISTKQSPSSTGLSVIIRSSSSRVKCSL